MSNIFGIKIYIVRTTSNKQAGLPAWAHTLQMHTKMRKTTTTYSSSVYCLCEFVALKIDKDMHCIQMILSLVLSFMRHFMSHITVAFSNHSQTVFGRFECSISWAKIAPNRRNEIETKRVFDGNQSKFCVQMWKAQKQNRKLANSRLEFRVWSKRFQAISFVSWQYKN